MRKATYTEVGRAGTDKEFTDAFNKVADMRMWGRSNDAGKNLINGALEAFHEGRPEHLQKALVMAETAEWRSYRCVRPADVLEKVFSKAEDKPTAIELAMQKLTAEQRQKFIDRALNETRRYDERVEFMAALFAAGAEVQTEKSGWTPLASAIINSAPQEVIKLMYDHGAKFDDAQIYMFNHGYDGLYLEKLKFYKERIEGTVSPAEAAPAAAVPSVEEEVLVRVLEALHRLEEKVDALAKAAPEAPAPEGKKQPLPYPKI